MKATIILLLFIPLSLVEAQEKFSDPSFSDRIDLGLIEYDPINEASGIAASRKNSGVLWTHNDSGDPNRVFAFNTHGQHLGVYYINGAGARDWEDMAIGPGPDSGKHYLYIGEIGDNSRQFEIKYIYRVPEPAVDSNQTPVDTVIYGIETISYKYPDGIQNAETIMIDPLNNDIYVVSRSMSNCKVYRAPYPQSTTDTITLEHKATLDSTRITGGDISLSGHEILIKTYFHIFYWYRAPGEELWEALVNEPLIVPYIWEPQGEAVGWEPKEYGGYYTISEERQGIPAHLYFYSRLNPNSIVANNNSGLLSKYLLNQNHPNPFNLLTKIRYSLPQSSNVVIKVFDILGNEIETLVNEDKPVGTYEITWYAENLPSGIYFYRIQAVPTRRQAGSPSTGSGQSFVETKKIILLK
jgi:hypothetical protein